MAVLGVVTGIKNEFLPGSDVMIGLKSDNSKVK